MDILVLLPTRNIQVSARLIPFQSGRLTHSTGGIGQEDRVFVKSMNPKEEPFMKYVHTGRPCPFEALWYDELISMSTESLDSMGFYRRPFRFVLHKFTLRSCHSQSHGRDTTVFSLSDKFLGNKPLPKNWSDRENTYTEIEATLDKEGILLIRMRQGVSSDSDEQVGSSSQSTVTQTNVDKETYFPFTHKSTFLNN